MPFLVIPRSLLRGGFIELQTPQLSKKQLCDRTRLSRHVSVALWGGAVLPRWHTCALVQGVAPLVQGRAWPPVRPRPWLLGQLRHDEPGGLECLSDPQRRDTVTRLVDVPAGWHEVLHRNLARLAPRDQDRVDR